MPGTGSGVGEPVETTVAAAVGPGGGSFDARLIPEYDGTTDVVEWFTRAEVLCRHRGADLPAILPARLTGGAFAVWLQLPEDARRSTVQVRHALYDAFAMDQLAAYDAYAARKLRPGEPVDVYLADLRRLASLYGGVPEAALTCAFIAGLPTSVRTTIRAGTRAEALTLDGVLKRVRAVMSDERGGAVLPPVAAAVERRTAAAPRRRCWTCGQVGHLAAACPRRAPSAGNDTGAAPAPAPSPAM